MSFCPIRRLYYNHRIDYHAVINNNHVKNNVDVNVL